MNKIANKASPGVSFLLLTRVGLTPSRNEMGKGGVTMRTFTCQDSCVQPGFTVVNDDKLGPGVMLGQHAQRPCWFEFLKIDRFSPRVETHNTIKSIPYCDVKAFETELNGRPHVRYSLIRGERDDDRALVKVLGFTHAYLGEPLKLTYGSGYHNAVLLDDSLWEMSPNTAIIVEKSQEDLLPDILYYDGEKCIVFKHTEGKTGTNGPENFRKKAVALWARTVDLEVLRNHHELAVQRGHTGLADFLGCAVSTRVAAEQVLMAIG